MSPITERCQRHLHQQRRSAKNLEQARQKFTEKQKYSSSLTRQKLRDELSNRSNGLEAFDWQVDVSEALLLGLDCTVIAGTGAGKTMPFVMPLFIQPRKSVLIISPLNALEEDQATRFRSMGISAVAVNGETYTSMLHNELENGNYQVILSSPEMCLKHSNFRKVLSSARFSQALCSIVVDEAHCITQWGPQFRPEYADLGNIRAFSPHTPVLLTSATLTPSSLDHACKIMQVDTSSSYHLMLGIDRANIAWSVRYMTSGKDLDSLQFVILPTEHGPCNSDTPRELIPTMVFFDDISLAMSSMVYLRRFLPPIQHEEIAVYNSRRTSRAKKKVMELFRNGKIKILLTTEAAGMGCDIPHVKRVVQFMVPKSLDIWLQRGGRAGRDKSIRAEAILLVQPSIFQEVTRKKGHSLIQEAEEIATDSPQYRKEIHDGLRQWIEAVACRRDVADEYYDSGVLRSAPVGICCDNCQRKAAGSESSDAATQPPTPLDVGAVVLDSDEDDVALDDTPDDPILMTKRRDPSVLPERRRGAHLEDARLSLERWRDDTWIHQYSGRPWGPEIILPHSVISNIASKANVQSIEALIETSGWSRHRALRHGAQLLHVLQEVDDRERTRRISEKQKLVDERLKRKRDAEIAREAKKAEAKRRREEERLNRPKKPRLSRAKAKHVAGGVKGPGKENVPLLSAPIMLPTTSWPPLVPFTPPRPHLGTHASPPPIHAPAISPTSTLPSSSSFTPMDTSTAPYLTPPTTYYRNLSPTSAPPSSSSFTRMDTSTLVQQNDYLMQGPVSTTSIWAPYLTPPATYHQNLPVPLQFTQHVPNSPKPPLYDPTWWTQ